MDIFRIRFWPYMADTFVDVALYGHSFVCGDILYASVYLATGKQVKHAVTSPTEFDQSIHDLYGLPADARRIHHFRMQLEMYFGTPPLFFVRSDSDGITQGKNAVRQMVKRYQKTWKDCPLPVTTVSEAELEEMVCHDGQWFADSDELDRELERREEQAEQEPWAVPNWMLEPKPRKMRVRRPRRWIV